MNTIPVDLSSSCACFDFKRSCDKSLVSQNTGCPDVTWFWLLAAGIAAFAVAGGHK